MRQTSNDLSRVSEEVLAKLIKQVCLQSRTSELSEASEDAVMNINEAAQAVHEKIDDLAKVTNSLVMRINNAGESLRQNTATPVESSEKATGHLNSYNQSLKQSVQNINNSAEQSTTSVVTTTSALSNAMSEFNLLKVNSDETVGSLVQQVREIKQASEKAERLTELGTKIANKLRRY